MMAPLYNVQLPFVGAIPGGFAPGKMIRIRGTIPLSASRFAVNLQCGPNISPYVDIALHLSPKFTENIIARNSLHGLNWGPDETVGHMPLVRGQAFELLILCDAAHYKIAINGQHYTEFIHRIPYQRVSHVSIDGDVVVNELHFDGPVPVTPSVGFASLANPTALPMNCAAYPTNPSPYQSSFTAHHTVLPTNPSPYPTNPSPYPTNPSPYPTNPPPYSTGSTPYPPVAGSIYGHTPYPAHVQGHSYQGYPGYDPKKAYKSQKKASKALKYGVPLAGVAGLGLGAYALSKGMHSGSSSSSSSSSSEEE